MNTDPSDGPWLVQIVLDRRVTDAEVTALMDKIHAVSVEMACPYDVASSVSRSSLLGMLVESS